MDVAAMSGYVRYSRLELWQSRFT